MPAPRSDPSQLSLEPGPDDDNTTPTPIRRDRPSLLDQLRSDLAGLLGGRAAAVHDRSPLMPYKPNPESRGVSHKAERGGIRGCRATGAAEWLRCIARSVDSSRL